MQSGVEGSLVDLQHVVGDLLDAIGNRPAVLRFLLKRPQDKQVERFAKMETKLIPTNLDYAKVTGLRNEARQKLSTFTPRSLGQALRISGITPADVTLVAVHLERRRA